MTSDRQTASKKKKKKKKKLIIKKFKDNILASSVAERCSHSVRSTIALQVSSSSNSRKLSEKYPWEFSYRQFY